MSCILVCYDNGKSSGWERKGSTVANGSPALFEHEHVPSKFIYVKKSACYRLMMRDFLILTLYVPLFYVEFGRIHCP